MTEVTSPAVASIASRYMDHEDPNVRALAASALTQAQDQAGGLTQTQGQPLMTREATFTYTGPNDTEYVSGVTFTKDEPLPVIDQGVIYYCRQRDDFTEKKAKAAAEAPKAEEPKPAAKPKKPVAQKAKAEPPKPTDPVPPGAQDFAPPPHVTFESLDGPKDSAE